MHMSILTESNFDGMFLTKLLAEERDREGIEIRVVGGLRAGYSFARTMLAVNRTPVAIMIDADSPEPEVALDRKHRAEEVLGDAAGGVPFRVIVAIPELEVLFFQLPELLERVFNTKIDRHMSQMAQLSPRRVIHQLAPGLDYEQARFKILREMNEDETAALRDQEVIRALLEFIPTAVQFSNGFMASKA